MEVLNPVPSSALRRKKQGQKFDRFIAEAMLLCHGLIAVWKSSFADHYHHIKVASFSAAYH